MPPDSEVMNLLVVAQAVCLIVLILAGIAVGMWLLGKAVQFFFELMGRLMP